MPFPIRLFYPPHTSSWGIRIGKTCRIQRTHLHTSIFRSALSVNIPFSSFLQHVVARRSRWQEDNEIDGSILQMMFEDKLKEEEEERISGGKRAITAEDRKRDENKEDGDDILSASLKVEK
jgi:hypothetical protein